MHHSLSEGRNISLYRQKLKRQKPGLVVLYHWPFKDLKLFLVLRLENDVILCLFYSGGQVIFIQWII